MARARRVRDEKSEIRRSHVVRQINLMVVLAKIEHARVRVELHNTDPALDRGFVEVGEQVARQLHIRALTVELEDTVGRGSGLGVEG